MYVQIDIRRDAERLYSASAPAYPGFHLVLRDNFHIKSDRLVGESAYIGEALLNHMETQRLLGNPLPVLTESRPRSKIQEIAIGETIPDALQLVMHGLRSAVVSAHNQIIANPTFWLLRSELDRKIWDKNCKVTVDGFDHAACEAALSHTGFVVFATAIRKSTLP